MKTLLSLIPLQVLITIFTYLAKNQTALILVASADLLMIILLILYLIYNEIKKNYKENLHEKELLINNYKERLQIENDSKKTKGKIVNKATQKDNGTQDGGGFLDEDFGTQA